MSQLFMQHPSTLYLREQLPHCYGKDTVEIYTDEDDNLYCFHYDALIAVASKNGNRVIYNIPYYDYSAATSRVRNKFVEIYTECSVLNKRELNKAENFWRCCEILHDEVAFCNIGYRGLAYKDISKVIKFL